MPINSNLLYGEMFSSFIIHLAIPVFVSTVIFKNIFFDVSFVIKTLLFIAICSGFSLLFQTAFLTALQAGSCEGVHNFKTIAVGSIVSTLVVGGVLLIPAFVEPMRVMVSQIFVTHRPLLTEAMKQNIASASQLIPNIANIGLEEAKYMEQTFQEFTIGASYWAAFAGAYGFGIGSLFAGKCT